MNLSNDTVAICGLFCARCPAYPKECEGCLSNRVAPHCTKCPVGFRSCTAEHHITRCAECPEFPCKRLENFRDAYVYHKDVVKDIKRIQNIGVESYITEQVQKYTCPNCGNLMKWDCGDGEICTACGYKKQNIN